MMKQKAKDDLDKTFARLMKKPGFRKEWEENEADYQLGRQIIQARIDKKISQSDLARKAKTTQAVISRIESMSVSPSLQMASRIAKALGKSLELRFV
jgi:ribosome-binding protein aMBF1 (putative translation factor)